MDGLAEMARRMGGWMGSLNLWQVQRVGAVHIVALRGPVACRGRPARPGRAEVSAAGLVTARAVASAGRSCSGMGKEGFEFC